MNDSTFAYHDGHHGQQQALVDLQYAYNTLLKIIQELTPVGRYRSIAITLLEQSGAMAVKGIFKNNDGSERMQYPA